MIDNVPVGFFCALVRVSLRSIDGRVFVFACAPCYDNETGRFKLIRAGREGEERVAVFNVNARDYLRAKLNVFDEIVILLLVFKVYAVVVIEDNAVGGLPCFNGSYEAGDYFIHIGAVIRAESHCRVRFIEIEVVLIFCEVAEHGLVLLVVTVEDKVVRAFVCVERCTAVEEDSSCFVLAAVKCTFEVVCIAVAAFFLDNGEGDVGIVYLHPAYGIFVYCEELFCTREKLTAVIAYGDMRDDKFFEVSIEYLCADRLPKLASEYEDAADEYHKAELREYLADDFLCAVASLNEEPVTPPFLTLLFLCFFIGFLSLTG